MRTYQLQFIVGKGFLEFYDLPKQKHDENYNKDLQMFFWPSPTPSWGRRGFTPRIRPPYPQRVVKGDYRGAVI